METTVNFEADKARLARAILNIDNDEVLEKVKRRLGNVIPWKEKKSVSGNLTSRMIEKFAGAWTDSRTAEEIVDAIYNSRQSDTGNRVNPFNE